MTVKVYEKKGGSQEANKDLLRNTTARRLDWTVLPPNCFVSSYHIRNTKVYSLLDIERQSFSCFAFRSFCLPTERQNPRFRFGDWKCGKREEVHSILLRTLPSVQLVVELFFRRFVEKKSALRKFQHKGNTLPVSVVFWCLEMASQWRRTRSCICARQKCIWVLYRRLAWTPTASPSCWNRGVLSACGRTRLCVICVCVDVLFIRNPHQTAVFLHKTLVQLRAVSFQIELQFPRQSFRAVYTCKQKQQWQKLRTEATRPVPECFIQHNPWNRTCCGIPPRTAFLFIRKISSLCVMLQITRYPFFPFISHFSVANSTFFALFRERALLCVSLR